MHIKLTNFLRANQISVDPVVKQVLVPVAIYSDCAVSNIINLGNWMQNVRQFLFPLNFNRFEGETSTEKKNLTEVVVDYSSEAHTLFILNDSLLR